MPLTVHVTRELPGSVAATFTKLADQSHWDQRVDAASSLETTLESFESTPDSVAATTRSTVPMEWLPALVRSRLDGALSVIRVEQWRLDGDGATGTLDFDLPGVDADAGGTASLTANGTGSVVDVALELEVHVPLIGGVIEQMVARQVEQLLTADLALLD